jgi:hypothetical protein
VVKSSPTTPWERCTPGTLGEIHPLVRRRERCDLCIERKAYFRDAHALRAAEPNAVFTVTLYDGPLFVASGAASTGRLAPSEVRTAAVAFSRALLWSCFQWSVATEDGRRRSSELIC